MGLSRFPALLVRPLAVMGLVLLYLWQETAGLVMLSAIFGFVVAESRNGIRRRG